MDPTIRLRRESKYSCLSENVRWAEVGPLSGKDPLVIVTCGYGFAWRTSADLRKYPLEALHVKYVLTQKSLDAFCNKFYIPKEVDPVLPNQNDTMHESLARKIGLYKMDIFAFIHTTDPTEVRIVEREWNEGEAWLLDTTIGRTIPLLPVAPDHAESELEASVEKLFDEGVVEAADTAIADMAPMQPRRQGKRKFVTMDAGGASHPPKKPKEDHGKSRHGYAISSLMDTAYWLSESLIFKISLFKLQNARLLLIFT
ncbi:hypothetical protein Tco_1024500, partial [Tanacetum coccineum]